jgi:hypothetical protein
LQLSIRRQRDVIAQDLLLFAQTRLFALTVSEKDVEFLVLHEMFDLLVEMIEHNALLAMDSRDMNVD